MVNHGDVLVNHEDDDECTKLRNKLQRAWENYNEADEDDREMYWRSIKIAERQLNEAGC